MNKIESLKSQLKEEIKRREQADAKLARVLSFLLILFHDDQTAEHQHPLIWKEIEAIGDQPAYLIKQLRELRGQLAAEIAKRKSLVDALNFYANKENWVNDVLGMPDGHSSEVEGSSEINQDSGMIARDALANVKQ